jgi:hypothetical protein
LIKKREAAAKAGVAFQYSGMEQIRCSCIYAFVRLRMFLLLNIGFQFKLAF